MLKTQSPIAALDEVTPRRGAAVLLDVLRSEGVRYIFGNPGTTELPLMDSMPPTSVPKNGNYILDKSAARPHN